MGQETLIIFRKCISRRRESVSARAEPNSEIRLQYCGEQSFRDLMVPLGQQINCSLNKEHTETHLNKLILYESSTAAIMQRHIATNTDSLTFSPQKAQRRCVAIH